MAKNSQPILARDQNFFTIKISRNNYRKFYIDDILFLKASGAYTIIKTTYKEFTVTKCLKEFNSILSISNFMKVNRSFIINIDKCVEIKMGKKPILKLANGDVVNPNLNSAKIIFELFSDYNLT